MLLIGATTGAAGKKQAMAGGAGASIIGSLVWVLLTSMVK